MKENIVLFVDDDINVLSSLKRGLMEEDYRAVFTTSGEKAMAIMEEKEVSVIVSDMRMPGMDGLQLLKIIKEKYPKTVKIVLSGYTQLPQILATVNQVDIFRFLTKPWSLEDELKPIIRQAVGYYNYLREEEKQKEALEKRNLFYQSVLRSTDEKFLQNKNDFHNIGVISKNLFNMLKEQAGQKSKAEILNALSLIEELYTEYLGILPTNIIDYQPERLESDLNKWLRKSDRDNWIDIIIGNDADITYRGNYILIYYVVTALLKYILPYTQRNCVCLSIEVLKNILIVKMVISKLNQEEFKDITINGILTDFLKIICKTIDCDMNINGFNEFTTIELKIPVQSLYEERYQ